jgi:ribosomal protein S27AE
MARASRPTTHRGFKTSATPRATTPTACPVCGETLVVAKGEKRYQVLEAHLMAQHRPDDVCSHQHRSDASVPWKLDWDAVIHATPGILLWYCSECGYYLKAY